MTHKNTVGTLMAALLVLVVGLACSGLKDDTEVANKLIDEGNASITESTTLLTDAATKLEALGDIKNLSQAPKLAPELIRVLDQAQEKCKTAAANFDEASKLKVDDKFKEYLVTKVKEFNKRAELV